jgi:hypothetical protein
VDHDSGGVDHAPQARALRRCCVSKSRLDRVTRLLAGANRSSSPFEGATHRNQRNLTRHRCKARICKCTIDRRQLSERGHAA